MIYLNSKSSFLQNELIYRDVFVCCPWWLRAPYPSNANNERNVNTSGALNNNNANNNNGVSADCMIITVRSSRETESSAFYARKDIPV